MKNQQGVAHILILIAILGLLGFLLVANLAGFKDKLFSTLFPKPASHASNDKLPPNDNARGLIYDGLEVDTTGECRGLYKVKSSSPALKRTHCSHGPDPYPDAPRQKSPASSAPSYSTTQVTCDGDGQSGPRVQVIYVRSSAGVDNYAQYLHLFQNNAYLVDWTFNQSAKETGGDIHVRFVHDSTCHPIVENVVLTPGAIVNFPTTINELASQGYNRTDRKYLVYADANNYCGQADLVWDDQPGESNSNNNGPSYGVLHQSCWSNWTISAHELMHTYGGVQLSAPNNSGGGHCVDEYDAMCYSDSPFYPAMQSICKDSNHEGLLDCNHDDYFSTSPSAGSYLDTHWNTANNIYLIKNSKFIDTTAPQVTITSPTDGSTVSRNSTLLVTGDASDNAGLNRVEIYVNNNLQCTPGLVPFWCNIKIGAKSNVQYIIQAKAYDTSNNSSSSSVTITAK